MKALTLLSTFLKKKFFLDNFCPPSGTRRQLKTANLGSLPKMDKYGQIWSNIVHGLSIFQNFFRNEFKIKF